MKINAGEKTDNTIGSLNYYINGFYFWVNSATMAPSFVPNCTKDVL